MAKIYTKKGDQGETQLVSGSNLKKSDPRIDLYGEVDELNSFIGLSKSQLKSGFNNKKVDEIILMLFKIQNTLFDLGSNLACEAELRQKYKLPVLKAHFVSELELAIDEYTKELPELKNFILPGGCEASCTLHLCRTVCRRIERKMVQLIDFLPNNTIPFINRLSDYFFVLSRYVNFIAGEREDIWTGRS